MDVHYRQNYEFDNNQLHLDLKKYLDQFFDGEIPDKAMKFNTWEELNAYLSGFVVLNKPEKTGYIKHKVYGFEKEDVLKVLKKIILY